jgi:hypothetical protein
LWYWLRLLVAVGHLQKHPKDVLAEHVFFDAPAIEVGTRAVHIVVNRFDDVFGVFFDISNEGHDDSLGIFVEGNTQRAVTGSLEAVMLWIEMGLGVVSVELHR